MAEHNTISKNGHLKTTVKIQPGESVDLCRCFKSTIFPLCDGSHKLLNNETGPVVVEASPCPDKMEAP